MVCAVRIPVTVAAVVVLLATGLPVSTAGGQTGGIAVGDQVTSFHYQPPGEFQGDLALRFAFDWGEPNPCRVFFGMSGGPSQAALWGLVASDREESYGFYFEHFLRAHAPDVQVDPTVVTGGENWSFGIFTFHERTGVEAFTIGGLNLTRWVSAEGGVFQNLYFQVDCERPFEVVALAGGDGMVGFSELGGAGVGAGFYAPVVELHAAAVDGLAARVDMPLVALVVRSFTGDGQAVGSVDLETPNGSSSTMYSGAWSHDELGGPGDYSVSLTQAAAGVSTTLFGAAVGLHPAANVDDLDRWTA